MYSSSEDIEIGATLRKARQDLGVTLDDVEYETKIRKRYLEALEREDYADLPSAVYARGFLKTYANYLNLNGEELSQELKDRWDAVQERQRRETSPKNDRFEPRSRTRSTYNRISSRRRISPLGILGFVFALALLAAAVGGLYWVGQNTRLAQEVSGGRNDQSGQPSENNDQSVASGNTSENESSTGGSSQKVAVTSPDNGPEPERTEPTEPPTSPEGIRMTVKVEQVPAWLNVQTDGNVAYEQVAQPGFSQDFEARQQIRVWTGNAGAVRLEINGQDYGALGAPGEVKRQLFTLKQAQG